MKRIGQGEFATLEVILMVTVIGILASIAVPRFNDITTRANTAKIQSDLAAIDTAITVYNMSESTPIAKGGKLSTLSKYLSDADKLQPPTSGKCYMGSNEAQNIPAAEYTIDTVEDAPRAVLGEGNTAGKFVYKPAAASTGG